MRYLAILPLIFVFVSLAENTSFGQEGSNEFDKIQPEHRVGQTILGPFIITWEEVAWNPIELLVIREFKESIISSIHEYVTAPSSSNDLAAQEAAETRQIYTSYASNGDSTASTE